MYNVLKNKTFIFDVEKEAWLINERGIGFNEVIEYIKDGRLISIIPNPNQIKYKDQKIAIIDIAGYVYMVPFMESGNEIFLKTIYPSRKATKKYLKDLV